jgi:hypothetical protein
MLFKILKWFNFDKKINYMHNQIKLFYISKTYYYYKKNKTVALGPFTQTPPTKKLAKER